MGFVNSGSEWNQRSDTILEGNPCVKQVNDIMGQGKDYAHLAADLRETLAKCHVGNITLSRKNVEIGSRMHYAGFIVSAEGCFPVPANVAVLKEFQEPQDVHDLRVF